MPYRLDKKQQTGIQVPHRFHASASESRSSPSDGVSHLKIFAEVPISEKGIVFSILVSRHLASMIHFCFETCCHLKVVSKCGPNCISAGVTADLDPPADLDPRSISASGFGPPWSKSASG